jgi:LysM repeat protein
MKNGSSQAAGKTGAIILVVILGLCTAKLAYTEPSEEDISGSSSVRTPPSGSGAESDQGAWSESSGANPGNDESAQGRQSDQGTDEDEGARVPHSSGGSGTQPRAYFPYTVRSGDTPAGIAVLFGVPLADLMKANHLHQDSELMIGDTLRVPNPFLARERELSSQLDRLATEKQAAEERAQKAQDSISGLRTRVQDLSASNKQYQHDLHSLPWWRAATFLWASAAAVMFAITLVAVVQWIITRTRFRAVAEMNESLRRLDYKYKASLAKAELRFQELYGRRRRGNQDGQELAKTPEEIEIEQLNRQLKEVLEYHLQRLGSSSASSGRARWRERLASIGAPMEARSIRR